MSSSAMSPALHLVDCPVETSLHLRGSKSGGSLFKKVENMVANTRGRKSGASALEPEPDSDPGLTQHTPTLGAPPPNTFGCGASWQLALEQGTVSQTDSQDLHDDARTEHRADNLAVAPGPVAPASSGSTEPSSSSQAHALVVKQEPNVVLDGALDPMCISLPEAAAMFVAAETDPRAVAVDTFGESGPSGPSAACAPVDQGPSKEAITRSVMDLTSSSVAAPLSMHVPHEHGSPLPAVGGGAGESHAAGVLPSQAISGCSSYSPYPIHVSSTDQQHIEHMADSLCATLGADGAKDLHRRLTAHIQAADSGSVAGSGGSVPRGSSVHVSQMPSTSCGGNACSLVSAQTGETLLQEASAARLFRKLWDQHVAKPAVAAGSASRERQSDSSRRTDPSRSKGKVHSTRPQQSADVEDEGTGDELGELVSDSENSGDEGEAAHPPLFGSVARRSVVARLPAPTKAFHASSEVAARGSTDECPFWVHEIENAPTRKPQSIVVVNKNAKLIACLNR